MGRFTEKQMLLATIVVSALMVLTFGGLIYLDIQQIHRHELKDDDPSAAEVTDPEEWGERRHIQEIEKKTAAAKLEADLIAKREQDVIVYREIVERDSAILPDKDQVNQLANTIDEFVRISGVQLRQVSDLNPTGDTSGQAIRTMPIKLQIAGTFDQFLKFVNLFETLDRMVNTRAFTVTAGRTMSDLPGAPPMHDIQLDLVTYIYNSSAGLAKPVDIANYERRKEDPVIQKLVRQQKAAHVDKYQLKPRINRRDPLVDPRKDKTVVPEGPGTGAEFDEQRQLVEKLKFEMELLKEDIRLEASFEQDHKYVQIAQLRVVIDDKLGRLDLDVTHADTKVTVSELREIFTDEVLTPFQAIKAERGSRSHQVIVSRSQVAEFLEAINLEYEERRYESVLKKVDEFDKFVQESQLTEDAEPLREEMRERAAAASVMLDFEKLAIKVQGVIRRPEGSIVILNGKSRRVADTVDPAGKWKLVEIHEDHLTFEFGSYRVEHSLERK